jgi:hypothetical protein
MQYGGLTVQGSAFGISQSPGDLIHPLLRRLAGHAGSVTRLVSSVAARTVGEEKRKARLERVRTRHTWLRRA